MSKRKTSRKPAKKKVTATNGSVTRGYRDIIAVGGQNQDWMVQSLSDDADLWQHAHALTSRVNDLFKTNPLYIKYRELIWANIFGSDGILLRMKIQETENRVVYAADEKWALIAYERRINRLREWAAKRDGRELTSFRAYKLADAMERSKPEDILERKAIVQIGDPDVFANLLFEGNWQRWQRKEFADLRGTRSYFTHRLLRLIGAVCDGDLFIRHIRDPKINEYGYSLQIINAQWCDRFLNVTLPNGNVIRMGIEYEMTAWGLGKVVAYYFIKRMPTDWQYSMAGLFSGGSPAEFHQRINANEIIHYARPVNAESTRPAPWVASTIPKGRQLDQTELAHVIAAREAACKVGFLYSDVVPLDGITGPIDPATGLPSANKLAPGETGALPPGVKYMERDPKFPNSNFEEFRKGMVRSISAGMPAADYNTLANDLENINFSAGRLGRLDTNEMSKMLQTFDIGTAETPIFEAWQEMAIVSGVVNLPLVKLPKYRKATFQGRRWAQVDEIKAVNAAALRVANKFSSRNRECAEEGIDFEENVFELAEEEMLLESLGLDSSTTVEKVPAAKPGEDIASEDTSADTGDTTKPAATTKPTKASNGSEELEVSRV